MTSTPEHLGPATGAQADPAPAAGRREPGPLARLNRPQRIVIVVGLAAALYAFGLWAMTWGSQFPTGWTGYAPLSPAVNGLAPWARFLIWLGLIAIWGLASVPLLRSPSDDVDSQEAARPPR